MTTPLWRYAPSPQGDAASAAGRPLHGGRWPGPRPFHRLREYS